MYILPSPYGTCEDYISQDAMLDTPLPPATHRLPRNPCSYKIQLYVWKEVGGVCHMSLCSQWIGFISQSMREQFFFFFIFGLSKTLDFYIGV